MALSVAADPGGGDSRCGAAACSCDRAARAEAALAATTASAAALRASLDAALGRAAALTLQLRAAERAAAVATGGALPVVTGVDVDVEGRLPNAGVSTPAPAPRAGAADLREGGSNSWSNCSELSQPSSGRVASGAAAVTTAAGASTGCAAAAVTGTAAAKATTPADVEMRSCTAADGLLLLSRAGAVPAQAPVQAAATAASVPAPDVTTPAPVSAAAVPAVTPPASSGGSPRGGASTPLAGSVRKPRTSASSSKRPTASKSRFSSASGPTQSRYWTAEEHARFLEALRRYGHKDLKAIAAAVATRNQTQARTHLQKWLMKIAREARRSEAAAAAAAASASGDAPAVVADAEAPATPAVERQAGTTTAAAATVAAVPSSAAAAPATEANDAPAPGGGGGNACAVPRSCGMTLLCLVGQDTLRV